ncbi:MAG: hypothetical protein JSR53_04295 [Proteobacteria bacterium]|nr:hypothetical protein [Pseudomonadota bacterium]
MDGAALLAQARAAPDWEVHEYRPGGVLAGFGMLKGTEFHCCLFAGAGFNRRAMREFLRPLFERRGFLTTRVAHGDLANQRFNKVFGFERTWSDEQFHYFLMAELPFGRA